MHIFVPILIYFGNQSAYFGINGKVKSQISHKNIFSNYKKTHVRNSDICDFLFIWIKML